MSLLSDLRSSILGGADAAYDTLIELEQKLQGEDSVIAAILTAISNRVAFDQAQTLTAPQKAQALSNIGGASAADLQALSQSIGDTSTDFTAIYQSAKAA